MKYTYKIASIVTALQSDVRIRCLEKHRFRKFTSRNRKPNSTVRYTHIDLNDSLSSSSFSHEERNTLLKTFSFPLKGFLDPDWGSVLLRTQTIRDWFLLCMAGGKHIALDIRKNSISVTDYLNHQIDHFYSSDVEENVSEGRIDSHLFSYSLHSFSAAMIHSSCVSFDGRAAVFLAMDEGGKTTAASLCKGGRVLADDQILFRKQDDSSWLAYGTPWTTFPPDPGHAVPAAFFLLEKADEFSLTELSSRELFSFLWDEHFKLRFQIPSMYQTTLFDLYRELSSSAPVYLMKFPKDYIDQDAILKCMKP